MQQSALAHVVLWLTVVYSCVCWAHDRTTEVSRSIGVGRGHTISRAVRVLVLVLGRLVIVTGRETCAGFDLGNCRCRSGYMSVTL